MRAAGLVAACFAALLAMGTPSAFAQSSRQVGPTMCACPGKHQPLGNSRTCEEACYGSKPGAPSGGAGSSPSSVYMPSVDYEGQRRAREAEEQAERERQAENQRRKEEAERQARFILERDAAAGTLRGSIGTTAVPNKAGSVELRGSAAGIGRPLLKGSPPPDLGGRHAAWKQLHCAASILGPAISALDLKGAAGKADYAEFRFLADEAINALNGQRLRVSCAQAPEMPAYSGRGVDSAHQAEAEKRLVAKTLYLGTKLEDARRKQDDAQATLRGAAAKVEGATADVIERQRRINRARDNAGNEMARAQRDFNEGKRNEESAKKELRKIEEKVESVVRGERVTFDEEPPVPPGRRASSDKK